MIKLYFCNQIICCTLFNGRPFEIRTAKMSGFRMFPVFECPVFGSPLQSGFQMVGLQLWLPLLSRFHMDFGKMADICPDFEWLGFQISDPIQNPEHLQPNIFSTIQNPDLYGFQIPTVFVYLKSACRISYFLLEHQWHHYLSNFKGVSTCRTFPVV